VLGLVFSGSYKDQTSASEDNGDGLEEKDRGREGHPHLLFELDPTHDTA
jgi:hypothetical protein